MTAPCVQHVNYDGVSTKGGFLILDVSVHKLKQLCTKCLYSLSFLSGNKLVVMNMSQQTGSTDLLGG